MSGFLYKKIMSAAKHPKAVWILAAISFAESSFFPVPPDVLLIPMGIARPRKVWQYAFICTLASVIGGIVGYFIGFVFIDSLAVKLLESYGLAERFQVFKADLARYAFTAIALKGLTPIPYKLVTIASGILSVPMGTFLSASIITRGARFFMLSGLVARFGPQIHQMLEQHMKWFILGTSLILGLGLYLVRFL